MERDGSAVDGANTVESQVVGDIGDLSLGELVGVSSSKVWALGGILLPALNVVVGLLGCSLHERHEAIASAVVVDRALLSFVPANNNHLVQVVLENKVASVSLLVPETVFSPVSPVVVDIVAKHDKNLVLLSVAQGLCDELRELGEVLVVVGLTCLWGSLSILFEVILRTTKLFVLRT